MDNRLEFHNKLCDLLGSKNCYFQPPSDILLKYPCIVYHEKDVISTRADDLIYLMQYQFSVTWITKTADIDIPVKVLKAFSSCKLDQIFASENLMHYIFTINIPVKE